ncbi:MULTISPECIES: helix-turn-helix domain-containing protein [unclassified Pseudomonas]|uniref:helix-turn-helix domain-containing protein n=2 Tax=unclassified Pseudomonas TaxID=196821 RepID=UPI002114E639|nr:MULTISPECIES: helix-turn-helix transcriptional regulator [unclassified Pseudomonas]
MHLLLMLCPNTKFLTPPAEVDRTYVSQIERCTGNPSLLVLCKLANTLEITTDQLLAEPGTLRSALHVK